MVQEQQHEVLALDPASIGTLDLPGPMWVPLVDLVDADFLPTRVSLGGEEYAWQIERHHPRPRRRAAGAHPRSARERQEGAHHRARGPLLRLRQPAVTNSCGTVPLRSRHAPEEESQRAAREAVPVATAPPAAATTRATSRCGCASATSRASAAPPCPRRSARAASTTTATRTDRGDAAWNYSRPRRAQQAEVRGRALRDVRGTVRAAARPQLRRHHRGHRHAHRRLLGVRLLDAEVARQGALRRAGPQVPAAARQPRAGDRRGRRPTGRSASPAAASSSRRPTSCALPIDNTTAERLAEWFAVRLRDDLRARGASNLVTISVEVEEAPGQSASAGERF